MRDINTNPMHNKKNMQDTNLQLNFIVNQIEIATGLCISELKKKYSEQDLFTLALKHVTTTKKALCTAIDIHVEAGCRYKRTLEKDGFLVQSIDEVLCPYTNNPAHLISINPNEFAKLQKCNSNQLNLFESWD